MLQQQPEHKHYTHHCSSVPAEEGVREGDLSWESDLVGCNPTFAKNGRSGASPIPGFVLLQKYCSPIRLQYFNRHVHALCANYITYTSIHNYYITVQNKSGYRAGTRPSVFRAKVGLHPTISDQYICQSCCIKIIHSKKPPNSVRLFTTSCLPVKAELLGVKQIHQLTEERHD